MADQLVADQARKKRDEDIKACESTATKERAQISARPLTAMDIISYPFTRGVGIDRLKDLGQVETKEHLCIYTARLKADSTMAVREAELSSQVNVLKAALDAERKDAQVAVAVKEQQLETCSEIVGALSRQLPPKLKKPGPSLLASRQK